MRVGIVGCGINGSYLAWKLSKAGHKVTVFEKKKRAGGKACSGMISERLWEFIPKNESLIENMIDSCVIRAPRKKVEICFSPRMLVINRGGLDRYVAELAEKAGAELLFGHNFVKIISAKKARPHIVSEANGKTVAKEFDVIMGCDGANSRVRRHAKTKKPRFRMGIYTFVRGKKHNSVEEASYGA